MNGMSLEAGRATADVLFVSYADHAGRLQLSVQSSGSSRAPFDINGVVRGIGDTARSHTPPETAPRGLHLDVEQHTNAINSQWDSSLRTKRSWVSEDPDTGTRQSTDIDHGVATRLQDMQSRRSALEPYLPYTNKTYHKQTTETMRLFTLIVAFAAALLALLTYSATWWSPTSVYHAASRPSACINVSHHTVSLHDDSKRTKCTVSEAQRPVSVQALLRRADLFVETMVHRGNVEQLNRFSSVSKDILQLHFSQQWNVTALSDIENTDAAEFLLRIEVELRKISNLPTVKIIGVGTAASLPNMRANYAEEALHSKGADMNLSASIVLLLGAAELYELGQQNEAVGRAYDVISSSWPELMRLSEQCWAAISKHYVPEVELCRIRALLGKVRDLAEDMRKRAGAYEKLSFMEPAVKRADDILAIVKKGCGHESEAVLQYLRNSVKMRKEPPKGPGSSGDEQADGTTWSSRVTERVQNMKWNLGW
ncbi:hypothetical protein LTR12_007252 [Friedmanniomyces endolithicus]|nr:hypothetical protein LTR12_007252 [Friedmanniomyces endolithicus]